MTDQKEHVARSTTLVSSATFVSRLFGLVREQIFAFLFGAGFATDAFVAAFRIPNLLRDLFAEGALSAAFVPVFTDYLVNKDKKEAFRLGNLVVNALLVILFVIVVIGILATPWIVDLIAPGFKSIPGKSELTVLLARIMFPFLLLVSLAAVAMGMLNSLKHFGVPAFAPVFLNVGMILSGFLICPLFDPPIIGMALGVLLGGLGQWAFQLPSLRKEGYRYSWIVSFSDPGVRRIIILMTPAILGLASTQINIFVNTVIASFLPQGSPSYLNYSFRLMHFPLGVFGVAVATVTLPIVATYAARKDIPNVLSTCASSLRLVFFLTLPSIFFLAIASKPIVSTLYQHGVFTYQDTLFTSQALIFYAFGLFAYASVRVIAPVFYSLGDTKTPVKVSVLAVAMNIALNLAFMRPFGFRGLALATSLSAMLNMFVLMSLLRRRVGPLDIAGLGASFLKILGGSTVLGAVLFAAQKAYPLNLETSTLLPKALYLLVLFILAAGSYAGMAAALKIKELQLVLGILKKKR
ncbi:MAG: murein biosynthesis integral membrane protein MurJ [Candidatus Aminicenantes bacterium RBG_19FT_COMBO_58_17]|nr:MAG: murein biosynthesis integral membrane protein MurJ [Candidatus Aminicenantes bacterium RBG_19FT_COMBO_58_17]